MQWTHRPTVYNNYVCTYVQCLCTHTQAAADQHQLPKQLWLKVKQRLCASMTVIRHSLQSETTLARVLGQTSLVNELIRRSNPILGLHQWDRKEWVYLATQRPLKLPDICYKWREADKYVTTRWPHRSRAFQPLPTRWDGVRQTDWHMVHPVKKDRWACQEYLPAYHRWQLPNEVPIAAS